MSYGFLDVAVTPGVRAVQTAMGTEEVWANFRGHREYDRFGDDEVAFITARDSLYMATVGATGWPYIQHRGGQPGFLKVLDEKTLVFPDYKGNLQYISVGNLTTDARAALILVDYPRRARMKILARVEVLRTDERPELTELAVEPDYRAKVERLIILHLVTFELELPAAYYPAIHRSGDQSGDQAAARSCGGSRGGSRKLAEATVIGRGGRSPKADGDRRQGS